MVEWDENMTLKMDGREDTFRLGSMEVERYEEDAIALKATSRDGRGSAVIRFSRQEGKKLINELIRGVYKLGES